MKKTLIITMAFVLSASLSYAGALDGVKNAVKSDINTAKNTVKSDVKALNTAVKTDINNAKLQAQKDAQARAQEKASVAQAKKQEKLAQMDAKIKDLNSQMAKVKADKTITETQRTLQVQTLQKQIDFYTKQKSALK